MLIVTFSQERIEIRLAWWRRLCLSSFVVAGVTVLSCGSFRGHPMMHTTGFILATVPVVVLMPTRPIAPLLITIYVCIGTLQHANVRWSLGPAGRVLVSPAYHRLHHAPDTQGANLGVVLTIWDILAGRARFPQLIEPFRARG